MKTIYKYTITGRNKIEMPIGASILSVNMQGRDYCIWALVDTERSTEARDFEVVGTGWELDDNMHYIGTCYDGPFVWHIMEVI
jgi:hypothetical protein